jgi:hypothetical protein
MTTKQAKQAPVNNNTNSKRSKKRAPKSIVRTTDKDELAYRVPECVDHFMAALVDPFNSEPGACLPAGNFPLPSAKSKVFVRSRMSLGTSGIGWVALTPTSTNDSSFMQSTTGSSVGTSGTVFSAFTNLQNLYCTQNQFTAAELVGGGVQARIVAAGIRVKYVGPLTSRSGTVTVFEDPDHQESRTFSYNLLSSHPQSERFRVGDAVWDGEVVLSGPCTPHELEFRQEQYPIGNVAPILIAVSGVAGDLYDIEGCVHYEQIGTPIQNKTKSHAEPSFFAKAIEAAKSITNSGVLAPPKSKTLWQRFKDGVSEMLPQIIQGASSLLLKGPGPMKALGLIGSLGSSILPPLLSNVQNDHANSMRSRPLLLK